MEAWYRELARGPRRAIESFQYDYAELRPLLNQLGGCILDIGGGLGVAREYLPSHSQYLIVEPSLAWLDPIWTLLDDEFPSLQREVDVIIGVGESLPLRSASFDVALALWSLNHTADPARTILEAHRVLRPQGRLIVVLEDIAPTAVDLQAHPDLSDKLAVCSAQPDHIGISEAEFQQYIKNRFTITDRRWMKQYLLLELVRVAAVTLHLPPAHETHLFRSAAAQEAQIDWWQEWFKSRGLEWPSDFEARLSPDAPLQSRIAARLQQSAEVVCILDVGSGPVSRAGRSHPSIRVRVTSIDPLADRYRALLSSHNCDTSLAPLRGEAESLDELFLPGTFDLVNMENALDQCRDPMRAISQMLEVVKPGGTVLLLHEENEADATAYEGACQWNIAESAGHLLIWNRDDLIDLTAQLAGRVEVVTQRVKAPGYREAVEASLRKVQAVVGESVPTAEGNTRTAARGRRRNLGSLAWTLVRTDFKIRYHGSIGGFAWALLRPLSLFFVLQTVFSLIFTMDQRYRLNLIVGLFLWEFFTEATRSGLASLSAKAHLLTKVRVPAWLLVVCSTANSLVMLAIFVVIILASLTASGAPPTLVRLMLFFAYLVQFYTVVLGFALAASVLFLRFRDVNQLWDLVTQVGFFATPIVYPLSVLPERIHVYLYAWPPTPVIQFARDVLVAGVVPSLRAHLLLFLASVIALLVGWLIFNRNQRRAVEYL